MAQAKMKREEGEEKWFNLLSGHKIAAVGLGTWRSGSQTCNSVFTAILRAGYRHIDTAWEYGVQEEMEMHPGWRNDKMLEACKKNAIHVTIAAKLNKTPGQVLVKWALQRGISVIPKSINPERIKENVQVFGWEISEPDFKAICNITDQKRVLGAEELFCEQD